MRLRVLSAAVAIPVLVGLIWVGTPTTALAVLTAAALALFEYSRLSPAPVPLPVIGLGIASGLIIIVAAASEGRVNAPLLAGAFLVPLLAQPLFAPRHRSMLGWAWMVSGTAWIALPLTLAVLLRQEAQGREWLLTAVLLTFAVDTAAFFFGKAFGRHKMAPSISPGKSWEGAVAGLVAGPLGLLGLTHLFGLDLIVWQAVVLGLAVSVAAQLGDLAESMVKRAAGAKDAGGLIPGHGGVFDRLDSLLPSVAVLYCGLASLVR